MSGIESAAVIGLGLMGGSLARDLAERDVAVVGWDRDPDIVAAAVGAGVLENALPWPPEAVVHVDLVALAVPVASAPRLLGHLSGRLGPESVITDLGSTKRTIAREAERVGLGDRFVGSHPLVGDHRSGWASSREGLYSGGRVFVVPGQSARPAAVERVAELWRDLGAAVEEISAAEHDRLVGWISHLPQVVSSALGLALLREGYSAASLGPGGRDVTRLAASSPGIWSDILLDNSGEVAEALDAFGRHCDDFARALRAGDAAALERMLDEARAWALGGPPAGGIGRGGQER